MNGIQQLLAFSETVKRGGFAAAARELGSAPSTIAKAVGRLESSLGVRLFYRTTRQIGLTDDGERLFKHCQRVLAELDELQAVASGARAAPRGILRVEMPVVLGRKFMLPLLARLLKDHPDLELDARLSDAYADLVRDRVDVAIRVGELDDSSLVARRFGWQETLLVASPGYLSQAGTPTKISDLEKHQFIRFRLSDKGRDRPLFLAAAGEPVPLPVMREIRFNEGEAIVAAAVYGLGYAQVPDYMVTDEIAAGNLVEILAEYRPPSLPIYAITPAGKMIASRVRVFLDILHQWDTRQES